MKINKRRMEDVSLHLMGLALSIHSLSIALSQQVQNMYGMFIKYVTSCLGCLRLPVAANSPLNSMGIYMYTVFDRAPLSRIGDLPNGLHTDLKFQNQAIQCSFFEPRGVKYDSAVGRERATSM